MFEELQKKYTNDGIRVAACSIDSHFKLYVSWFSIFGGSVFQNIWVNFLSSRLIFCSV